MQFQSFFESVPVIIYGDSLQSSDLQFGFKKQSSCCHAIFTFNETVRYFVKHGGRVHCAALDASKVFDKILHYGLFYKMLSKGISSTFVKKLIYCYRVIFNRQFFGTLGSVNVSLFHVVSDKVVFYHPTSLHTT